MRRNVPGTAWAEEQGGGKSVGTAAGRSDLSSRYVMGGREESWGEQSVRKGQDRAVLERRQVPG